MSVSFSRKCSELNGVFYYLGLRKHLNPFPHSMKWHVNNNVNKIQPDSAGVEYPFQHNSIR